MNPRVSRSSALASKATGFPIAKMAAKLAVGYALEEIPNDITRATPASFEPTIDYVVTKVPRFAFEKFPGTEGRLSTHMQSVGEAMAIGRTFRESFAKAMRSRELDSPPELPDGRRGAAGGDRDALRRALRPDPRGLPPRPRGRGRPRALPGRPLVPARAARRSPPRATGPRASRAPTSRSTPAPPSSRPRRPTTTPPTSGPGPAAAAASEVRRGDRDSVVILGAGPEPDRPGDRVRLLLRARGDDRARARPRRGDDQLQPGDGLDRLRHLRPPLLRAADRRGRARRLRAGAPRGRDRPVRRPDAAEARPRARGGRRAAARHPGRRDRPRRGPRPLRRPAAPARRSSTRPTAPRSPPTRRR